MLMVIDHQMNPGKYTQQQLRKNAHDAAAVAVAAVVFAARAAAGIYSYAAGAGAVADFWIGRYFEDSSENRQDYIDEINRRSK